MSEIDHKNILALKAFGDDSRRMINEQAEQIQRLSNAINQQQQMFDDLLNQIASIRIQMLNGGPTSGAND